MTSSVTTWPYCVFNIWPFASMKICPKASNFCQSVGISPNLVTLMTRQPWRSWILCIQFSPRAAFVVFWACQFSCFTQLYILFPFGNLVNFKTHLCVLRSMLDQNMFVNKFRKHSFSARCQWHLLNVQFSKTWIPSVNNQTHDTRQSSSFLYTSHVWGILPYAYFPQ